MQSLGEMIEQRTTSFLNAGLGQASARSGSDAVSFGYDLLHALPISPEWEGATPAPNDIKGCKKGLEAGASDLLARPINTEQLLSVLRMWLRR